MPSPEKLSDRSRIDPFIVMDLMSHADALECKGNDIIHMEVGQPSTPAPETAIQAAEKALRSDKIGYTLALGIDPLRERICQYYKETHNVDVSPERVIVTTGSSAAFILAFLACFNPGDRVAQPRPGYPCYRKIMGALNIGSVDLPPSANERWMPDSPMLNDAIRDHDVKGVIMASPANPTGSMLTGNRLESLVSTADLKNIWFISDEIYHGITFEEDAKTALQYSDNAIVINSFSKYFSMTGWRVGWMIVPDYAVRSFERLAQNLFISAPTLSQYAALGAFDGIEQLEQYKAVYRKNRDLLLNELPAAGLDKILPADGAFYLYADVSHFTDNSHRFCLSMLEDIGVAATPGLDFDPVDGNTYVRFSYSGSTDHMAEAAKRIRGWLSSRLAK